MSAKLKFPSNASTPAKLKKSDGSGSVSSVKSFLTSVLTPSHTKWKKRKKSSKFEELSKVENDVAEKNFSTNTFDEFNEPGYSSVQELQLKHLYPQEIEDESSVIHSPEHLQGTSNHVHEEPLYATVNKQKKSKCQEIDSSQTKKPKEIILNENPQESSDESGRFCIKKVEEDHKEEIKLLAERLQDLANENRELRKNIEDLLKEEKWKEDSLHAELKLKISQLEAETHKEVNMLSEQILTLQKERKVLVDQISILHEEKKLLKAQCSDLNCQLTSMVSAEFMAKTVEDHQRFIKQLERKHEDEIKRLRNENELVLDSKIASAAEVDHLKEKLQALVIQNETLRESEQELLQENNRMLTQLNESKQIQEEVQNLLMALLKLTENISIERDILLDKVSYQDNQQNLIKTSIMNYSLNMGRLQEHIANFSKEKFDELQKLKTEDFARDASMKNFYSGQVELLRSKVMNQCDTISDLQSEKGKLELQLESLWQSASNERPKLL